MAEVVGEGVPVAPLGVAEGSDGDAVGVGEDDGHLSGGDGGANKCGMFAFGLGGLRALSSLVNSGNRRGGLGLAGVLGVADGRVEGGGGGMTKGDRGEKMLLVRDRNDGGGKDGTKKGGSIDDGRRPKP